MKNFLKIRGDDMSNKMIVEFKVECSVENSFKIYDDIKKILDTYIKYANLPNDRYLKLSSNARKSEEDS